MVSVTVSFMMLNTAALSSSRITTYDNRGKTASGIRVTNGVVAHSSLPLGTIVEIDHGKRIGKRLYVVADRTSRRRGIAGRFDVWTHRAGPGVLPDYGRTRVVSRGQFTKMSAKSRRTYILSRLRLVQKRTVKCSKNERLLHGKTR